MTILAPSCVVPGLRGRLLGMTNPQMIPESFLPDVDATYNQDEMSVETTFTVGVLTGGVPHREALRYVQQVLMRALTDLTGTLDFHIRPAIPNTIVQVGQIFVAVDAPRSTVEGLTSGGGVDENSTSKFN